MDRIKEKEEPRKETERKCDQSSYRLHHATIARPQRTVQLQARSIEVLTQTLVAGTSHAPRFPTGHPGLMLLPGSTGPTQPWSRSHRWPPISLFWFRYNYAPPSLAHLGWLQNVSSFAKMIQPSWRSQLTSRKQHIRSLSPLTFKLPKRPLTL